MKIFIVICFIAIIACLVAEKKSASRHRCALKHVIHVNGTRGKSGVTRLIAAGIAESGMRVYCKTTGTLPMTINSAGEETEIKRFGKANILEQIKTLKHACEDKAEVLVIECMAVDPELQWVCEHKILHSDIGVITNARIDHVAEMGSTITEVCDALCNTIPDSGVLFTSDSDSIEQMKSRAEKVGSEAILADNYDFDTSGYLFPENIALALAVCEKVGVDKETALRGMSHVQADPYEVDAYELDWCIDRGSTEHASDASNDEQDDSPKTYEPKTDGEIRYGIFVNGMSANDPASTKMILDKFRDKKDKDGRLIIVLNCRPDRGYRTDLMIDYVLSEKPDAIWLMGRGSGPAKGAFEKAGLAVTRYKLASELPFETTKKGDLVYAIGNIADQGFVLMDRVRGPLEDVGEDESALKKFIDRFFKSKSEGKEEK